VYSSTMFELPDGYIRNKLLSNDNSDGTDYWANNVNNTYQVPAYKWVQNNLIEKISEESKIIEIGCGNGSKTHSIFSKFKNPVIGIDQASGIRQAEKIQPKHKIEWCISDIENDKVWCNRISAANPSLIVCFDVIEHLENPDQFLNNLRNVSKNCLIVISTPDRNQLEYQEFLGPPSNSRHMQEWTTIEFKRFLLKSEFIIENSILLYPRTYNFLNIWELLRIIRRLLLFRKIPDRKSCQLWVLR
jgi:2-polyprenyl-3-methyl-5-hydroxy-6-metoxy-1,4-benzoquinol methylase